MTGLEPDDYVFLEKFLDVTKANLFFAKGVLIVEGDGENILLPTIAECLGHPLEDYGVSIVNVGSTAYARFGKIFIRKLAEENDGWLDIPVACLRDLDLWPEKADNKVDQKLGWKTLKKGNKHFWLPRNDSEGNPIGTFPEKKKKTLEELSQQNVKVFVSDEWTFEYCLIQSGLDYLVCEALGGIEDLSDLPDEKALQMYRKIDETKGAKTELAYKLSELLKKNYSTEDKRNELLEKLPNYIKAALKHVLNLPKLSIDKVVPDVAEEE
jgi:putative ATP-dependent endonuclease of OLD family